MLLHADFRLASPLPAISGTSTVLSAVHNPSISTWSENVKITGECFYYRHELSSAKNDIEHSAGHWCDIQRTTGICTFSHSTCTPPLQISNSMHECDHGFSFQGTDFSLLIETNIVCGLKARFRAQNILGFYFEGLVIMHDLWALSGLIVDFYSQKLMSW